MKTKIKFAKGEIYELISTVGNFERWRPMGSVCSTFWMMARIIEGQEYLVSSKNPKKKGWVKLSERRYGGRGFNMFLGKLRIPTILPLSLEVSLQLRYPELLDKGHVLRPIWLKKV